MFLRRPAEPSRRFGREAEAVAIRALAPHLSRYGRAVVSYADDL